MDIFSSHFDFLTRKPSGFLFLLALFFCGTTLFGQSYILYPEVPVQGAGGEQLQHAWTGGLNNPQFSNMDVNDDGLPDLFVFDRQGDVPMIFLADGINGAEGWTYSPVWSSKFPVIRNWAFLRDVNCDGIEDLITSRENGVVIYIASFDGGLHFDIDTSRLTYVESSFTRFLGVTDIDIPALEDVDGDMDRDVLTFNLGGGYVEWYRNRAAENGDPCGPLDLELEDQCWGRFYENGIAKSVQLDTCQGGSPLERDGVHSGSTLMAFDEDGDGDLELVLGDLSFDNLNGLHNGGTPEAALMTQQDTLYPRYDEPYHLNQYPAAFYADADQDGRPDMLVSPNSKVLGRDIGNVSFYRDTGTGSDVVWERQAEDFLVGDMVDVGRGANPVFFDYNRDGLADIAIGNGAYTPAVGTKIGQLALFKNVGTTVAPAFELVDDDFAGISLFGFENVHPAFGDVDGDGDEDLVIGEENGLIHLFANNPVGGEASFTLSAPGWQGVDPGKTSTPQLIDLDRDGDLDLLIGERNGNINFYRNDGTPLSATFSLVTETFGGIVLASGATNIGEVQPFVVEDPLSGEYRLYVGERTGRIWRYDNWESDLTATFTPLDSTVGQLEVGERSRVALSDLNGDDILELLAGNMRGGLSLYREGEPVGIPGTPPVGLLNVWPNPASTEVNIHTGISGEQQVGLSDAQGVLHRQFTARGPDQRMVLRDLPAGWYCLWVQSAQIHRSAPIWIQPETSYR